MNKKQFILDNIQKIDSTQRNEIVDIINKHNIEYMENNYGIFLSLNGINEDIVTTMFDHIHYCLDHKQESKVVNIFEKDNLQHLNDYLKKNESPEPIIEKKIKKNTLPSNENEMNITIELTDSQKEIVQLSKRLKIE